MSDELFINASESRAIGRRNGTVVFSCAAIAAALLVGCRSPDGLYPVGIYSVPATNDFAFIQKAGFNLITTPLDAGRLEAAYAHKLKVLASPGTSAGPDFSAGKASVAVRA